MHLEQELTIDSLTAFRCATFSSRAGAGGLALALSPAFPSESPASTAGFFSMRYGAAQRSGRTITGPFRDLHHTMVDCATAHG
jgi:hypothetical protein